MQSIHLTDDGAESRFCFVGSRLSLILIHWLIEMQDYVDPVSKRRYWLKTEVTCFLKLGQRYKYKRAFGAPKRETHREQLQMLGREFCLESVEALRRESRGSNTAADNYGTKFFCVSRAHGLNGGCNTPFNSNFNPISTKILPRIKNSLNQCKRHKVNSLVPHSQWEVLVRRLKQQTKFMNNRWSHLRVHLRS